MIRGETQVHQTGLEHDTLRADDLRQQEISKIEIAIQKYHPFIEEIIKVAYERGQHQGRSLGGQIGEVSYRTLRTFRHGKQQPVIIIEFLLPNEESFQLVCKKDGDSMWDGENMWEKQQKNQMLQRRLPKIFLEHNEIAAIEKINGLELGPFREALHNNPELRTQLVSDAFEIIDDVLHSNFFISDADFTGGHNVIYDSALKKFRIFDIHSFWKSPDSFEKEFLKFLDLEVERIGRTVDEINGKDYKDERDLRLQFLVGIIRSFLMKYPDSRPSYQGELSFSLIPNTSEYDTAYEATVKRRAPRRVPYGRGISVLKEGLVVLDEEIKQSCLNGDSNESVYKLLKKNNMRATSLQENK